MITLNTPISNLGRIGARVAKHLKKLGLENVRDLIFYYPFRYNDLSHVVPIKEIRLGELITVKGKIELIQNSRSKLKKKLLTEALVRDEGGKIKAVWFNQPYLAKILTPGTEVYLSGRMVLTRFGPEFMNPEYEPVRETQMHTARIVPVYPLTEKVTQKQLRYLIKLALPQREKIADDLPEATRKKLDLPDIFFALEHIHFPQDKKSAEAARRRLKFDELLIFQLVGQRAKRELSIAKAPSVSFHKKETQKFVKNLPFELTNAQRRAAWEILKDLSKGRPMNRLLDGDVGSGKTVVAAIAMLNAVSGGCQAVLLAPTEILAKQHFETLSKLFSGFKARIGLLTGSYSMQISTDLAQTITEGGSGESSSGPRGPRSVKKLELLKKISSALIDIIIGTHALLEERVRFNNLALAIVDEQHRFGVEQRAALLSDTKNTNTPELHETIRNTLKPKRILNSKFESFECNSSISSRLMPHFLSMTATPIPRSLVLTLYGDLDLSTIGELPPDRKEVITRTVVPEKSNWETELPSAFPSAGVLNSGERLSLSSAYGFIRQEVKKGRQVYVICPLIDPSDKLGARSVQEEYQKLSQEIFPDLTVSYLHGKMRPKEKEEIMKDFLENKIQILVSTSVVEVGVDAQNATVMMIEGAERFGLAQLHQFRGRVGRSAYQSYCFLFQDTDSSKALQRLEALVKSNNGFLLAEKDLEMRGPGEMFGTAQSGWPEFKIASIYDIKIIKEAHDQAELLIQKDPELSQFPGLLEKVKKFEGKIHLE